MALGLGLLGWIALLFSPLAMVSPAMAQDSEDLGTVIGIVSSTPTLLPPFSGLFGSTKTNNSRISVLPTAASV
jgi:hypothetical protein